METNGFAVGEQFNSGAPIPTVTVSDMKQMWDAMRRMSAEVPTRPNTAIGVGVYALYGVEAASRGAEHFFPVMLRHTLLSALVDKGVLREHLTGESLDEKAFRAAATMPCDKNDLAEALLERMLAQSPPDVVAKAQAEMSAVGYDPNKPKVVAKFLAWLSDHC